MSWSKMRAITSLEDVYEQCSDSERRILFMLRDIILEHPHLKENLSYGVPYFKGNRQVFFLWPASAAFGPKHGVLLGFCHGYLMHDPDSILEHGTRKQVYTISILDASEIDTEQLSRYVAEAVRVDEGFAPVKSKKA